MAIENEEWLLAREVLALVESRFEFEGMAENVLLNRLEKGTLEAYETGTFHYAQSKSFLEEEEIERGDGEIIQGFWWALNSAISASSQKDSMSEAQIFWETGDFSFRFQFAKDEYFIGHAHGVVFHRAGIADILGERRTPNVQSIRTPATPIAPSCKMDSQQALPVIGNRGRRPARWWPDFAEELAIYLHEKGLPETQEALISGVQSAMTAAGKDEPSRAQIQPVIRAVFSRLHPAGN